MTATPAEAALLAFVAAKEGTLRFALGQYAQGWQTKADEWRAGWEAGEADPAVAAAQDAEKAMSHERYRLNAVACAKHAADTTDVLADVYRLMGRLEAERARLAAGQDDPAAPGPDGLSMLDWNLIVSGLSRLVYEGQRATAADIADGYVADPGQVRDLLDRIRDGAR